MRARLVCAALLACISVVIGLIAGQDSAASQDDAENLRPGLVTVYKESGERPQSYATVEPTIAFMLKAGESPHPRLTPRAGFAARWSGRIRILRTDKYRFSAFAQGQLKVIIDDKEVLAASPAATDAGWRQGAPVALAAGMLPISVEFTSRPGPARIQLFWEASYFRNEPVPHEVLKHSPEQEPLELARDQLADEGHLLAEKHSCTGCHQPNTDDEFARSLNNRLGPDLSQAGNRLKETWIQEWLEDPHKINPQAMMPAILHDPAREESKKDVAAIAAFLTSLGKAREDRSPRLNTNELRSSVNKGEKLFATVGCAVCHVLGQPHTGPNTDKRLLPDLQAKTTVDQLARYLQNPLSIDAHGYMPSLLLTNTEAQDLARFLWYRGKATMVDSKTQPGDSAQLVAHGEKLVSEKRCANCHTINVRGKSLPSQWANANFEAVKQAAEKAKGCLNPQGSDPQAPNFAFSNEDLKAVRVFLASAPTKNAAAPTYSARLTLQRMNCLGCHNRDGQGGLTTEMTDSLRKFENVENAEAVSPPPLTGVGSKLHTAWIRQVLTQAGRARPWMALRMPQFGAANVDQLAEALAALDGVDISAKEEVPAFNSAYVDAGRFLVGKKGFGCIACHDIAGVAASGTRGPDLALMQQRVRYSWYRRWLEQPQRMQPGTRMPTIFADGRTLIDDLLHGRADAQADAIWVYLALGMSLPLPEGLEPPKGLALVVKDRPIILRTFMPEAGSRAIAVGYPENVSIAFDAAACRLAYAWSGNFLDASPAWNDRGGSPAKPLGQRIWDSPRGFPWIFTANNSSPDFVAQTRDPALGAPMPEGQLYAGPQRLFFNGYTTDAKGEPAFHYRREVADNVAAVIGEHIQPLRRPTAVGIARQFIMQQPNGFTAWLLAGESGSEPRVFRPDGTEVAVDLKSDTNHFAASGLAVLLPQSNRWTLLQAPLVPDGGQWRLHHVGNLWQVSLRLPPSQAQDVRLTLRVWQPYRPEIAVVRELLSSTRGSP